MSRERQIVVVFSGGGTGGHLYPALTLADALSSLRSDVRPFFVGARRGVEARVLPERGVEHELLPVQGLKRGRLVDNLSVLRKLTTSLGELVAIFRELRPELVVVTGGYAAAPAGLVAAMMRIPLVVQEQNAVPGLTSRLLSLWAQEVHLAFPEARAHLPWPARREARVSGNPVRPPTDLPRREAVERFGLDSDGFVVLVLGGSQGSLALNRALLQIVEGVVEGRLPRPGHAQLLWATGPDHEDEVRERLAALGEPRWVRAIGYIREIPDALAAADLAVSRGGAMATAEFLAWGLPAVLVPLPTSAADHQSRNADALAAVGAAVHMPEEDLTPDLLWNEVVRLVRNPFQLSGMASAARKRGRPHAARDIARHLAEHLPPARETNAVAGGAP